MKTRAGWVLSLALASLTGQVNLAVAQHAGMAMAMPTNTLLVAQLDAKQVAGGSASSATGTGAFLLDPAQHTLSYRLTYEGLVAGGAKSIALYNFGKGKNGEAVKMLCGAGTQPCPNSASATISGRFEHGDDRVLDNKLIGEFDSQRVYVEIVGGDGKPEIRGQLAANGAMVRVVNYVVHLASAEGTDSNGSGTAVFSETYLPGGKVSVFYALTVAGASGAPIHATLGGSPAPRAGSVTPAMVLPQSEPHSARDKETGGTLTGLYEVNAAAPDALLAARLLSTGKREAGIVVTTRRFPEGELYGPLVPVR